MAYDPQGIASEDFGRIQVGWNVIGSDNEQVGQVDRVEGEYFVVSKGWIFTSERFIPITAVQRIEPDNVYLSVSGEQIEERGWDSPEAIQSHLAQRRQATEDQPLVADDPAPTEPTAQSRTGGDSEHMELREEELRAQRTTRRAGEVDVGKEVHTEREEMDVPRHHEEVDINYRPTEARRPAEGEISEGEEIRVPLHEEDVQVDKETVVSGEVDIEKRDVEESEHISEDVQKERMRVEREGDVRVNEDEERSEEDRSQ